MPRLSQASRTSLERAFDWWQKSMHTSKHKTFFVIAGYDSDAGQEIQLRRAIAEATVQDPDLLANILEVSARGEVSLAPHALMAGGRVSAPLGRLREFGQVLVGGVRTRGSAFGQSSATISAAGFCVATAMP